MGKVYKIEIGDKIYYGSTKQQLCKRQSRHNWNLRNNPKQLLYKTCIEENIEKIICIGLYDGDDYKEKEQEYIRDNMSLNMRHSILSIERKKETREKYLQSEKGKQTIAKISKTHRDNHKEYYKELKKKYYLENSEKWKTDEYKAKQKLRENERANCPHCNTEMLKQSINRHIKRKHST